MPDAPLLPLSVSIVCCNNERTIGRTLESVDGLAREVVALDSGSTDGTLEILRAHGARIVEQEWLGYVKQKQRALEECTQDWVLHLDSDESVDPGLRGAIEMALGAPDPAVGGYECNRRVWYAGGYLKHAWQPEWRLRLVRRNIARWTGTDPHDYLELTEPNSRTERLGGHMRHDSIDEGIGVFLAKQAGHARTSAAAQVAKGRRGSVPRLVLSPVGEFAKQVISRGAWRDGWRGWVAASASSVAVAMKHAAILEASRAKRDGAGG